MAHNYIQDKGAIALALNTKVTSLDLSGNDIGDKRSESAGYTITSLKMCRDGIGSKGAAALALNTTLTSLDLHGNKIEDDGAMELARNTTLTSLNLEYNESLSAYHQSHPSRFAPQQEGRGWSLGCRKAESRTQSARTISKEERLLAKLDGPGGGWL